MRRATTPTHEFKLTDITAADISKVLITYSQFNRIILEKTEAACTIANSKISVTLTQAETKLFTLGKVLVQLRILTTSGQSLESEIFELSVEKTLNDEVMQV